MADTNLSARVWPEDSGTGTSDANTDWDSAGYIAGMAAKDNTSDYVEAGLGITPDYATPAFDLDPGLAYIKYTGSVSIQLPSDDASTYSGTWDQGVTFAVDVDQQTGITLTDAATNRIYLATDLTTNDGAYIRVDTETSPNVPTDPYIKIAEIDTSNDTTTELNREPDATFGDVSVTGKIDSASASVDEMNNIYHLDPDVDDWGAAVNSISQEMSEWDILVVPPVKYTTDTTAQPDKQICICGRAPTVRHHTSKPSITKTSDVPIIDTKSVDRDGLADVYPAMISLSNLTFDSSISGSTRGLALHGRSTLENVVVNNMGDHAVHLDKLGGDNLNGSKIDVSGIGNAGDLVRLENNSTGTTETNGCKIEVHSSANNNTAVNIEGGFGNRVNVNVAESGHSSEVVRLNDTSNVVWIYYIEGQTANGVTFDGGQNTAYIGHTGLDPGTDFVFNNNNNTGRHLGDITRGFASNKQRDYLFLERGLQFQGPGGSGYNGDKGGVYLDSDGEVYVENAAGTTTQIS